MAQMLGESVRDFSFELGVRVVEVCRQTRAENGGLVGVEEVRGLLKVGRGVGGGMDVTAYALFLSLLQCRTIFSSYLLVMRLKKQSSPSNH